MPNRILKESLVRDARVDQLSAFEECTFYRLLLSVDDYGNIDARPAFLKSMLYPTKEGVESEQIECACARLCELGLVVLYHAEGGEYLHFADFETDQKLRYRKRIFPQKANNDFEEKKLKMMEMLK